MDTIVKDNDVHLRDKSAPVSLPLSKKIKYVNRAFKLRQESTDPDLAEAKNLRPQSVSPPFRSVFPQLLARGRR
ncbi:MAG: hypothetical protein ACLSA6_16240 [Holdemania massiliensis]